MSAVVPLRAAVAALGGYQPMEPGATVRLNTNESPYPPPAEWRHAFAEAMGGADFHRYPDRDASELRAAIAAQHGVAVEEVFCANGSNDVLQCLLLAFGGAGRRALVFEPTYPAYSRIAVLTGTDAVTERRGDDFRIDPHRWPAAIERAAPDVVFLCSPNNPTGQLEDPGLLSAIVDAAPGLVVVDEAYGQFAGWSALSLRGGNDADGLVVVRTFSKTWALAGGRIGYLIAGPQVVSGCRAATLPFHLSVQTQIAGLLALRYEDAMDERVGNVAHARGQLAERLTELDVDTWPSDANFLLFRPRAKKARDVWSTLLASGVLVRDFSTHAGLEGCLRVSVGTQKENERFLEALATALK